MSFQWYGYFNEDHSYTITQPDTPRHWYNYMFNDDGIVTVVLTDQKTTEPTTEEGSDKLEQEDGRKIIIIVSIVCLILLIIAIITVAVFAKKKSHMTDSEKMHKRKAKEKGKKNKRSK